MNRNWCYAPVSATILLCDALSLSLLQRHTTLAQNPCEHLTEATAAAATRTVTTQTDRETHAHSLTRDHHHNHYPHSVASRCRCVSRAKARHSTINTQWLFGYKQWWWVNCGKAVCLLVANRVCIFRFGSMHRAEWCWRVGKFHSKQRCKWLSGHAFKSDFFLLPFRQPLDSNRVECDRKTTCFRSGLNTCVPVHTKTPQSEREFWLVNAHHSSTNGAHPLPATVNTPQRVDANTRLDGVVTNIVDGQNEPKITKPKEAYFCRANSRHRTS